MERAVTSWLATQHDLPAPARAALAQRVPRSYSVYGCMLVVPATAFGGGEWAALTREARESLYAHVAARLRVTHIARAGRILASLGGGAGERENTQRRPSEFAPVWGDFGPATCAAAAPTPHDFARACWVTARQNGIRQTWAPRWSMFSRGNVAEKARLLALPAARDAVRRGRRDGRGCAAVDLYAGIGYFAFSYARVGVDKVLCWDLSAWSCEGLRRGAAANGWGVRMWTEEEEEEEEEKEGAAAAGREREWLGAGEVRFVVFNESNALAPARLERLRAKLPPIRHVNCGLLPSSRASWEIAARALDPEMGGWAHVHENFRVDEIERKAEEARAELERIVRTRGMGFEVVLEHVNRLKSYAPGVMHCVLDIAMMPGYSGEEK